MIELTDYIRDVPDFPKPGILFRDITPLLGSPEAFSEVIDRLTARYQSQKVDAIVAVESRGFIFGAPLAIRLERALFPFASRVSCPTKRSAIATILSTVATRWKCIATH